MSEQASGMKTVQPGETLVEIKNLKKYFPVQDGVFIKRTVANVKAVDDVSFEIKKGAITARVSAVALEDGSRGDRIRVSVLPSERELKGVVASRDLVNADLGSAK